MLGCLVLPGPTVRTLDATQQCPPKDVVVVVSSVATSVVWTNGSGHGRTLRVSSNARVTYASVSGASGASR